MPCQSKFWLTCVKRKEMSQLRKPQEDCAFEALCGGGGGGGEGSGD